MFELFVKHKEMRCFMWFLAFCLFLWAAAQLIAAIGSVLAA